MSLRDLSFSKLYKTYKSDIIKDFYTPALREAVLYERAVGFFSSGALIDLTKGISGLINNGGKIRFIVSPRLTEEDIEAINKGYEKKTIIDNALLRDFVEPKNYFQEKRLNYLAYLIEAGYLDIKVAFTPPNKETGMYHEKVGIITDAAGDSVVFTGSMNETINAFYCNSESIVVFTSWEASKEYVDEMKSDFHTMWEKNDDKIEVLDFPDVVKERFQVYRKSSLDEKMPGTDIATEPQDDDEEIIIKGIPRIPNGFDIRKYQEDAINAWSERNFRGIFDMATGDSVIIMTSQAKTA